MKVGFIGLGNMGAPMAQKLAEAGHVITGYDLMESAIAALPVMLLRQLGVKILS